MDRNYPILDLIDRALSDPSLTLASAANAAALERRARSLANAYWSDLVWLTGAISSAALDRVANELLALRIAPIGPPVDAMIESAAIHAIQPDLAA